MLGPAITNIARHSYLCLQIFTSKGIITANELREATEALDSKGRKQLGAQLVARAWTDPPFKARLLKNAAGAAAEMGIPSSNFTPKELPPGGLQMTKEGHPTAVLSRARIGLPNDLPSMVGANSEAVAAVMGTASGRCMPAGACAWWIGTRN